MAVIIALVVGSDVGECRVDSFRSIASRLAVKLGGVAVCVYKVAISLDLGYDYGGCMVVCSCGLQQGLRKKIYTLTLIHYSRSVVCQQL